VVDDEEHRRARYQAEGKQMGTLGFQDLDILTLGPGAAMARGRWRLKMPDGKESSGMTSVTRNGRCTSPRSFHTRTRTPSARPRVRPISGIARLRGEVELAPIAAFFAMLFGRAEAPIWQ
jgi:hypothetical protein